jgi:hypothetical protein
MIIKDNAKGCRSDSEGQPMSVKSNSRRDFLKKTAYVAPVIMTLAAAPAFASYGSMRERIKGNNGLGNGEDPQPPGNPPVNDGPGTGPGNRSYKGHRGT